MVGNIIENVIDQCQKDTLVKYASAYSFIRSITLEDWIILINKLHSIYCLNYYHTVTVKNVLENVWKNYTVEIMYPAKLDCEKEVIIKELKNLWPILNRNWPKFRNDGNLANLKCDTACSRKLHDFKPFQFWINVNCFSCFFLYHHLQDH